MKPTLSLELHPPNPSKALSTGGVAATSEVMAPYILGRAVKAVRNDVNSNKLDTLFERYKRDL